MARVDYTGIPDTPAAEDQPQDQLRVEASPASFGAPLAQGAEAAGAGAIDYSKFYSGVAADHAVNNLLQSATTILRGDPSKTATDAQGNPIAGPDGQPMPDTGFLGKRGADAMHSAADATTALDEAIAEQRSTLQTPQARQQFENESRRYRAQYIGQIASHADEQSKVWADDTYSTKATLALSDLASNPTDSATITRATDNLVGALKSKALLAGQDPAGAELKAHQTAAETQVKALLLTDPVTAEKAFDANKGLLASTPGFYGLGQEVKKAAIDATFAPAVDGFVQGAVASTQARVGAATGAPAVSDLATAFLGQESGNNPNAPTSITGARGPGQIEPGTFARYAKPGENIANPADNRAVASRILDHYNTEYNGDIGRIATAYFSGEGNVAPAGSPTPYIQDRADGTPEHPGKTDIVLRRQHRIPPRQVPLHGRRAERLAPGLSRTGAHLRREQAGVAQLSRRAAAVRGFCRSRNPGPHHAARRYV